MPTRRLSAFLHRAILAAALVALSVAQTLGALHAIVHAPRLVVAGDTTAIERAPRTDGLAALFAGHPASDHACDLYDQLSHGYALATALPVLPPALPAAGPEAVHAAWQLAREAAGFLARGPTSSFTT